MEVKASESLQVQIVRKMQEAEGHKVCFATEARNECEDKACCWRHDCFEEALFDKSKNTDA